MSLGKVCLIVLRIPKAKSMDVIFLVKSKPTRLKVIYFGCGVIDDLFSAQVTLVTNQKFVDVFTRIAINFLEPLLDVVK